jgi:hypothetical protein
METALRLCKAHREDGKGEIEGDLVHEALSATSHIISLGIQKPRCYAVEIKPETLSIYTGLTAEWVAEGIDPRIWSGDLFEAENRYWEGHIDKWKVIYKNAAFYVQRLDNEEIEELLFDLISDNVYTKIGSIHQTESK